MTAVFGPQNEPELFSPRNGLLISGEIESVLDSGILAIVPDVSEGAGCAELLAWVTGNIRH